MKGLLNAWCLIFSFFPFYGHAASSVTVGAAPRGDALKVASRIIKHNFPSCKRVRAATRLSDGSIKASCDGTEYRVATVYSAKDGKMLELALNCAAAREIGVEAC